MKLTTFQWFLLVIAVGNAVLVYSEFVPFLMEFGPDVGEAFNQMKASYFSRCFTIDLLLAAAVVIVFIAVESRRLGMNHAWIPILLTCIVGVGTGLPAFLLMRKGAKNDPLHV
jgi:hypothetical protein